MTHMVASIRSICLRPEFGLSLTVVRTPSTKLSSLKKSLAIVSFETPGFFWPRTMMSIQTKQPNSSVNETAYTGT